MMSEGRKLESHRRQEGESEGSGTLIGGRTDLVDPCFREGES